MTSEKSRVRIIIPGSCGTLFPGSRGSSVSIARVCVHNIRATYVHAFALFHECCSDQAEGALGRDELEGDATEDAAGHDAGRQQGIRSEEKRGGGLAVANGNSTRENASGRAYRRRTRDAARGTKGTFVRRFVPLLRFCFPRAASNREFALFE